MELERQVYAGRFRQGGIFMIGLNELLNYLGEVDKKLKNQITLIAVGGTALVLMNLKESTKDVDFCLSGKDYNEFEQTKVKTQFKVDLFKNGYIFCQQLPEDYVKFSLSSKHKFKNINLKLLNPHDIIITKLARFNERDIEDILQLLNHKKIKKEKLRERFEIIKKTYPGNEKILEENFNQILKI